MYTMCQPRGPYRKKKNCASGLKVAGDTYSMNKFMKGNFA